MKRVLITGLVAIMSVTTGIFAQNDNKFAVAIAPAKMNVLYCGIDKPVNIAISGVESAEKVSATISQGTLTRVSGSEYIAKPATSGEARIDVFAEIDGQKKPMGGMIFRVKLLPVPVAKVAGKTGGEIDKDVLASQIGVIADMEAFLFDVKFTVTQFEVAVSTPEGDISETSTSNNFTPVQKNIINNLAKGQRVFCTNIKAAGPAGIIDLRDIYFTVN
jgi:gliding motility-associated protein GldM